MHSGIKHFRQSQAADIVQNKNNKNWVDYTLTKTYLQGCDVHPFSVSERQDEVGGTGRGDSA